MAAPTGTVASCLAWQTATRYSDFLESAKLASLRYMVRRSNPKICAASVLLAARSLQHPQDVSLLDLVHGQHLGRIVA